MNGVAAFPICCLCSFCLAERRREMRVATIFSRSGKLDSCLEGRIRRYGQTYSKSSSISPNFGHKEGSSIPLFRHSCRSFLNEFTWLRHMIFRAASRIPMRSSSPRTRRRSISSNMAFLAIESTAWVSRSRDTALRELYRAIPEPEFDSWSGRSQVSVRQPRW